MKKDDGIEKFLRTFTKEEILQALVKTRLFRRMAYELCNVLFDNKSRALVEAIDRNIKAGKNCKTIIEYAENNAEYKKLNAEADRIFKRYSEIR